MNKFVLKTENGQTSIEYILMLVVVVAIVTSLLGVIKKKYLGDPSKCTTAENKRGLLCQIQKFTEPTPDQTKKFQTFPFRK